MFHQPHPSRILASLQATYPQNTHYEASPATAVWRQLAIGRARASTANMVLCCVYATTGNLLHDASLTKLAYVSAVAAGIIALRAIHTNLNCACGYPDPVLAHRYDIIHSSRKLNLGDS